MHWGRRGDGREDVEFVRPLDYVVAENNKRAGCAAVETKRGEWESWYTPSLGVLGALKDALPVQLLHHSDCGCLLRLRGRADGDGVGYAEVSGILVGGEHGCG